MPELQISGGALHYSVAGANDHPSLLLLNALGTTTAAWEGQLDAFASRFHVIRFDPRGHGLSSVFAGDYTLEQLGADALSILDVLGVRQAHVCGVSLGGQIAQWLAINHPHRVDRLIMANTAARIGSVESWQARIEDVCLHGMAHIADLSMARWFTSDFRLRRPRIVEAFWSMLAGCSPLGYIGTCAALRDADLRPSLGLIRAPSLVVTGRQDMATPTEAGEFIRMRVPGSALVALDAAHLSHVEQSDAFASETLAFLSGAATK